jgi:predicted MFS family arabinose efflux permease
MPSPTIWRNAAFVRVFSAASVSIFGTLVTRTALPFAAILVLGAGPLEIAAIRACEIGGGLIVGLVAGAWIDRLRRRPVMIAADLGQAVVLGSVPVAALAGWLSIPQLIIVALLASAIEAFHNVADVAYLPTIVERDQIVDANSALTASRSVAEVSAFSISGFLVQILTAPITIAIDAVSFIASAIVLATIRNPEPTPRTVTAREPILTEIWQGLQEVGGSPILRALAAGSSAAHFVWGVFGALYLLFLSEGLGLNPAAIGLIAAVGGAASFVGAILAGRVSRRIGIGPAILVGLIGFTAGCALLPIAPVGSIGIAIVLLVGHQLIGDSFATINEINELSLVQSVVPNRLLGRVQSSVEVLTHIWLLAGVVGGGLIAERFGIRTALWIGVLGGVAGIVFLWISPLRTLRTPGAPGGEQHVLGAPELPLAE